MELTPWTIYLISLVGDVAEVFTAVACSFAALAAFVSFLWFSSSPFEDVTDSPTQLRLYRAARVLVLLTVVFGSVAMLLPSTKTLIAAYSVPLAIEVAQDVEIDETTRKAFSAINKLLDEYLEEGTK